MSKLDRIAAELRDHLPEPGDSPIQHLRHTLAAFDNVPADELLITATSGVYPEGRTGLTFGDLDWILSWLESSEEHLAPDHPAFGRG